MKCAYMFSSNAQYLQRIKATHRDDINTLGMVAHRAAYTDGDPWLEQLLLYIDGNMAYTDDFIKSQMPLVRFVKPQGTYLAWLDVSRVIEKIGARQKAVDATSTQDPALAAVTPTKIVERYFVEHAKVHMLAGAPFGLSATANMRMNIGTSRKTLQIALTNLASALANT